MRIAFAKGRGSADCMRMLNIAANTLSDEFTSGRRVMHHISELNCDCVVVRGDDIRWYLENEIVDIAVGSKMLFLQKEENTYFQFASLPIGICRLSLIAPDSRPLREYTTIAARYPALTEHYLKDVIPNLKILPLSGCIETAQILNLCDAFVDIIETGWSVQEYEFQERLKLADISHGVWIRRNAQLDTNQIKRVFNASTWRFTSDACTVEYNPMSQTNKSNQYRINQSNTHQRQH